MLALPGLLALAGLRGWTRLSRRLLLRRTAEHPRPSRLENDDVCEDDPRRCPRDSRTKPCPPAQRRARPPAPCRREKAPKTRREVECHARRPRQVREPAQGYASRRRRKVGGEQRRERAAVQPRTRRAKAQLRQMHCQERNRQYAGRAD